MNGIFLIDKPAGWTSFDVVNKLKHLVHTGRVGHSGTLDPMATGLLVVFIGRATRAVEFAEADSKRYIAGLRLGITTDTQDTTGTALSEREVNVTAAQLSETLAGFVGAQQQIPPMYSAIKLNGQRLYDIARKGGEVERKPRDITVHDISLVGCDSGDYILDITCSKGTYIRTLCNDIGEKLECGGCMSSLRRIRAGSFSVDDAHTIDEMIAAADSGTLDDLLLPVDKLFSEHPAITVNARQEKSIRNGGSITANSPAGKVRVYSENGEFLALARAENGVITTIKSFFEV